MGAETVRFLILRGAGDLGKPDEAQHQRVSACVKEISFGESGALFACHTFLMKIVFYKYAQSSCCRGHCSTCLGPGDPLQSPVLWVPTGRSWRGCWCPSEALDGGPHFSRQGPRACPGFGCCVAICGWWGRDLPVISSITVITQCYCTLCGYRGLRSPLWIVIFSGPRSTPLYVGREPILLMTCASPQGPLNSEPPPGSAGPEPRGLALGWPQPGGQR